MGDSEMYLELFNVPNPAAARVLIGVMTEDMDFTEKDLHVTPYGEQLQSYNATKYWSLTAEKLIDAGITFTLVYRTTFDGDGEVSYDPVAGRYDTEHGEFGDALVSYSEVAKIAEMTDVAEIHAYVRQITGVTWSEVVKHWEADRNPVDDLWAYSYIGTKWVVTRKDPLSVFNVGDHLTYYQHDGDHLVFVRDSDTLVGTAAEASLTQLEEDEDTE